MYEQKHAISRILVYAVALIAVTTVYAATEDAVAKNVPAKHVSAKHAAARSATAKKVIAKNAVAKGVAGRRIAAKRVAAKNAAAKNAAAKKAAAKSTAAKNVPLAVSLKRLTGSWKGDESGLKVKIEQGSIGWEAWLSTDGQARITQPEADPQIIKIQSRNITCTYTVTLPDAQTMKWELAPGQPDSRCLGDSFTKLGLAPAKVSPIATAKAALEAKSPARNSKSP